MTEERWAVRPHQQTVLCPTGPRLDDQRAEHDIHRQLGMPFEEITFTPFQGLATVAMGSASEIWNNAEAFALHFPVPFRILGPHNMLGWKIERERCFVLVADLDLQ